MTCSGRWRTFDRFRVNNIVVVGTVRASPRMWRQSQLVRTAGRVGIRLGHGDAILLPDAGGKEGGRGGVGSKPAGVRKCRRSRIQRYASSASLSNAHRPSLGAVHRYQVVAAADPNHSPVSKVAPWLLPSTTPSVPSSTVACVKSSLAGRESL